MRAELAPSIRRGVAAAGRNRRLAGALRRAGAQQQACAASEATERGRRVAGPTAAGSPGLAGLRPPSPAAAPAAAFDWDTAQEHCRAAYLRGRFLAHGSLSLASGRHAPGVRVGADEAAALCEHLGQFGLHASWRLRRGRGVVTWKSARDDGHVLRLVAAPRHCSNSKHARSRDRSAETSIGSSTPSPPTSNERSRPLRAARGDRGFGGRRSSRCPAIRGPSRCAGRRDIPEASFTELAERLELHRSAVQRALARIERLALHGATRWGAPPDALAGVTR